ncbi:hypothetical protein KCP73_18395 [Salmonella enterica subsp. enterica]|nr:hypothetical protein KCP73_18395 [Salmonella enterica subsp. enterica]
MTRAMRSPALRARQSAPDPEKFVSLGACGTQRRYFPRSLLRLGRYRQNRPGGCVYSGCPPTPAATLYGFAMAACWAENPRPPGELDDQPAGSLHPGYGAAAAREGGSRGAPAGGLSLWSSDRRVT